MSRFSPDQAVVVLLQNGEQALPARIVENIDAKCSPLTDMWLVKVDGWNRPFGITGRAIVPANRGACA
jgi:hypothetical protein